MILISICAFSTQVHGDAGDRSAEYVLNRCWDRADNTLKANITGTGSFDTLSTDVFNIGASVLSKDTTLTFAISSPDIIEPSSNKMLWRNNTGRTFHILSMRANIG